MANVKNRVNASKKKTKKGRGVNKKTPIVNNAVESITVMKRPSNLKALTAEEKVQYLLNNGHLFKDMFIPKPPLKNGKLDKDKLPINKNSLMSSTGKLRKARKDNLRLFDNILKSELMISDSNKKTKSSQKLTPSNSNNNNDIDISDHNVQNSESESKRSSNVITPKGKQSKSVKHNKVTEKKNSQNVLVCNARPAHPAAIYECDHCGRTFCSKSSLRRHIYGHLNLQQHQCPHCTKKFRYALCMQDHVLQNHQEALDTLSNFVCEICDQSFVLQKSYDMHLTTHMCNDGTYKCLFCEQIFPQYMLVTQHERQHLVNNRYQCSVCNMNYNCREHLSFHLKTHLKIKDFICQYCGKEFLRLNSMHRHVQVCHSGHRIQCPVCKKSLKGHLTEHMRTHEKRRPHKCPDCGQRFTQSTQLNVHRRSHTGARPYPCRICKRFFSHSNALMLHIRRHTGEKPFPCAMCPITFSQLPHMKAHMKNIHGKEKAYKCTKCEQFFKLKADLEYHLKSCTEGDRELSFEEKVEATVKTEDPEIESVMSLSRMRFLLALLLTMIATKDKLKYLGFNKRLIDDLLIESLEAMAITPCKDKQLTPIMRLKTNIQMLLNGTVPKKQMEKLKNENKTTEEILELLTGEKKND